MKIIKIEIENFKSIQNIEFDIKKYGNSYTTMLVGINESGKSNVLEAMSFFNVPEKGYKFTDYCHQKIEDKGNSNICFHLEFENPDTYLSSILKTIENTEGLLDFKITSVKKSVFLAKDKNKWDVKYDYQINSLSNNIFIKAIETNGGRSYQIIKNQDKEKTYQKLTEELFREYFHDDVVEIIQQHEPKAILWKPSNEYLISTVYLNQFSKDIDSSPTLKNIFLLAGYDGREKIHGAIANVSNPSARSRLRSILSEKLNHYLKKIWKHSIDVVIEITETGKFDIFIKDSGTKNEHDRFSISGRSDGAKHFLSLILSLSIRNETQKIRNRLILIDEPEIHLHPSGIRDLSKELVKIGKKNFVFVSTHSPFLIDKVEKTRNIILKKNDEATTEKREIKDYENFIDDEVLREAFGIEVYKDLLNPHNILVEGASDKIILQKAFEKEGGNHYGITNGHGSNIDTLAAKLNDEGISILIVLDDDEEGRKNKDKIIKLGGQYSDRNVCTIRDLVGEIKKNGTIEDTLGINFVKSNFKKFYETEFKETCDLSLIEDSPFIKQIQSFLQQENKTVNNTLNRFKKHISESFKPTNERWKNDFPLLKDLVNAILNNFSKNSDIKKQK